MRGQMNEWLIYEGFMSEGLEGTHGWSYPHHLRPSTPCLTTMEYVLFPMGGLLGLTSPNRLLWGREIPSWVRECDNPLTSAEWGIIKRGRNRQLTWESSDSSSSSTELHSWGCPVSGEGRSGWGGEWRRKESWVSDQASWMGSAFFPPAIPLLMIS